VLSEDLIRALQQLIILGRGDRGRLEYMLDLLQRGKILPDSDLKYLKITMSLYLESEGSESDKRNAESAIEQIHKEIRELNERIRKFETKGFEKYIGRKAILFFVTIFVGWNALQGYLQNIFLNTYQNEALNYAFPLNMVANYFNYGYVISIVFVILLLAWPFIGGIHMAKFIQSRKVSR
jgi:hypothetical protein